VLTGRITNGLAVAGLLLAAAAGTDDALAGTRQSLRPARAFLHGPCDDPDIEIAVIDPALLPHSARRL
jgi:hypothetical protein